MNGWFVAERAAVTGGDRAGVALAIAGCAPVVRLVSLPLLLRAQGAFRQREAAASAGDTGAAPDWAAPFLECLLLLVGAGVLTTLLPNTTTPVDLRGASVALRPENPLDLGTLAAEIADHHVLLYTDFAIAGAAGAALTVGTPDATGDGIPDIWAVGTDGVQRLWKGDRENVVWTPASDEDGWTAFLTIG